MTNRHPERDPEHLRYALRCAARIEQLIAVEKRLLFDDADMLDALCWNMYQLADVTGKLSDAVKARHPEVPWRAIAGLRNFYAHAYEGIDPEQLWRDLRRGDVADLAVKLAAIARELAPPPDPSV
jgi:uncharacterized protein with HEPN domain